MKNEVDEFLKQVQGDKKEDTFIENKSDPLGTSDTDEDKGTEGDKGTDQTKNGDDQSDKALPYHKDPKLQRYIEKEIKKRMIAPAAVAPTTGAQASESTLDQGEEILTRIIGNDTPEKVRAIKDFKVYLSGLKDQGAQQALDKIRTQEAEAEAEFAQERETLISAFESLEEEFDVDLTSSTPAAEKERNAYIDFIKRIAPKNADGDVVHYPDFKETYKMFKAQQKPGNDNKRAKDIASRSMARSTDSGAAPTGGKTWKDVDRIFTKLQN